jgi:large repetitive protein
VHVNHLAALLVDLGYAKPHQVHELIEELKKVPLLTILVAAMTSDLATIIQSGGGVTPTDPLFVGATAADAVNLKAVAAGLHALAAGGIPLPADAPSFNSAPSASIAVAAGGTFAVVAVGSAPITLTASPLPAGVTFTDNGAGSGTITVPPNTPPGTFSITIIATNANGATSQSFTLTISTVVVSGTAPVITSSALHTLSAATGGSLPVTATGTPVPKLTASGTFPGSISFANGAISVAPTPAGTYSITITADNGVAPAAVQTLTLTLN